ncbi:hypothetical protein A3N99_02685 [Mycobacteroides abscessus]|uniref:hypothetical protein n=1 Tax=Mycobacteroides abscessus TaxID=36809 RepID=UPI00078C266A|nr:hypothetical protein [Mycobacteroides abscessus]AMU39219.1 hypothetical protein A3N99_02685 [Mycobacteroides abscessus]
MIEVIVSQTPDGSGKWQWTAALPDGQMLGLGGYADQGAAEKTVDTVFGTREAATLIVDLGEAEINGETEHRQKMVHLR